MPYYLIYEPCPECESRQCLQCLKPDRQLNIRVVLAPADRPPANSLNGPCATPQELLGHIARFFDFDPATGKMYFTVPPMEQDTLK